MPSPAIIAADEFARRRATASRKVAAGELAPSVANQLVMPWLAIACRAGADIPELAEDIGDIVAGGVLSPGMARTVLADDICPLPRLRETLRNATAAAIRQHEAKPSDASLARGRALIALSRHFRAGPIPLAAETTPRTAAQQPQGRTAARSEGQLADRERGKPSDPDGSRPAPEGHQQRSLL